MRTLLVIVTVSVVVLMIYLTLVPKQSELFSPEGYLIKATGEFPPCTIFWFRNSDHKIVSGVVAFGENRPQIMVSHQHGDIQVPSMDSARIPIPGDGCLYVPGSSLKLHKTDVRVTDIAADWKNYGSWAKTLGGEIREYQWQ